MYELSAFATCIPQTTTTNFVVKTKIGEAENEWWGAVKRDCRLNFSNFEPHILSRRGEGKPPFITAEQVIQTKLMCDMFHNTDHICILSFGLKLVHSGSSCRGISLRRDNWYFHLKRLLTLASVQASSSPIPRIQMWSTVLKFVSTKLCTRMIQNNMACNQSKLLPFRWNSFSPNT